MENMKRALYLLEVAKNYLIKLDDEGITDITINYDDAECDGSCLANDIKDILELLEVDKRIELEEQQYNTCESCKNYQTKMCEDCYIFDYDNGMIYRHFELKSNIEKKINEKRNESIKQNNICMSCKHYNSNKCIDCGMCSKQDNICRCYKDGKKE